MKRILLEAIQGGEILDRDLYTVNGNLVMGKGSVLKIDYVNKLKDLGIEYLYVKDESGNEMLIELTEMKFQEECCQVVKNTIEKYSYCGNVELRQISKIADKIMHDVFKEKEVMYNVSMIRDKSQSLYGHSINVCALSTLIALHMDLKEDKIREIAVGSLLHDIGFAYLPTEFRDVKLENCNDERISEIKKHVINGYSAVNNEDWIKNNAKDIILSHHERCDGSGYPFRNSANKISKESKIVGLCDEFDSLVYGFFHKPKKIRDTFDYLVSEAGRKFDLNIVNTFLACVAAYPIGSTVILNTGEIGCVIRQNNKMPTRPVICIQKNIKGEALEENEFDLLQELTVFITDTLD